MELKTTSTETVFAALTSPGRTSDLCARTGLPTKIVYESIRRLRVSGLVHVSGWKRADGNFNLAQVYAQGNRIDAPRPTEDAPIVGEPIVFAPFRHPMDFALYGNSSEIDSMYRGA